LGREPKSGLAAGPAQMIKNMDAWGADVALTSDFEAIFYDMYSGNDKTLATCSQFPQKLIPLAVINPLSYEPGGNYLADIARRGARGFLLLPFFQQWKLDQHILRHLAERFSEIGLPVQIGISNLTEFQQVVDIFGRTEMPVFIRWLRGAGYNAVSDEIAAAIRHKNFYFDISNLVLLGGISYLAKKIGSERLYFASNSPLTSEASIYLLLDSADLVDKDRENIYYKNLARIFGINNGPWSMQGRPIAIHGEELAREKIDIHWHSDSWNIIEPARDIESAQKAFLQFGYRAVISSSVLGLNYDLVRGNQETEALVRKDGRVYGYVVVDPTQIEVSLAELKKYSGNRKFVGIKTIQDYYPVGLDDERYATILEWANKRQLPILAHRLGLAAAAKKFPKVIFIAAHCDRERSEEFVDLPNVILDVSGSYAYRAETYLAGLVRAVGSERVIFASDGPLISPAWTIGKILDSCFTKEVAENIYWRNAARIFKIKI